MKKSTRKALKASIEHWEQNLDMLILNHLSKEEDLTKDIYLFIDSCPLCKIFYGSDSFYSNKYCTGCPVFIATGSTGCDNSPWNKIYSWHGNKERTYAQGYKIFRAEILFLKSLQKLQGDDDVK